MPLIRRDSTTLRASAFCGTLLAVSLVFAGMADQGSKHPAPTPKNTGAGNGLTPPSDFGFIENKGQWNPQALFYAGTPHLDVWVSRKGLVYDFYNRAPRKFGGKFDTKSLKPSPRSGQVVTMEFLNSNPNSTPAGVGMKKGHMNYIRNRHNYSGVSMYEEAGLKDLYAGVDLRVYKDNGYPRYDLVVAPNADASQIKFSYKGASGSRIDGNGSLLVKTRFGDAAFTDLKAYQNGDSGKQPVAVGFRNLGFGSFGFTVGNYDHSKPLVIDPVVYSTLFGSFAVPPFIPGDDIARAVAVDSFGSSYVTGNTDCPFFPATNGAYDNSVAGTDAFITKFKRDGSDLVYSTILGGDGTEIGTAIAVDDTGRAHVTGATDSLSDDPNAAFPTTNGAPQQVFGGGGFDAFVVRLSADGGTLEFGTYLGGNGFTFGLPPGDDIGWGIGLDAAGNMYVGGQIECDDFPTTVNAFQPDPMGGRDGFVAKITQDLFLEYSTRVGGIDSDSVFGIAVDGLGFAHITGQTGSIDFPTTPGAFDTSMQQGDAFVAKVVPTGDALEFCTLIGGSAGDDAAGIAIDAEGNSYICGSTSSVDFPRTLGCYDNTFNPDFENYVTKVSPDGAALVYSTFMNGGGTQSGIAVDDEGVAHVCGYVLGAGISTTATGDDQTYNGPPPAPFRIGDAYLQALNAAGSELFYGSYFGGEEDDFALGIFIDHSRNAYVVGATNSWKAGTKVPFPTTAKAFKPFMENDNIPGLPFWDAFVFKAKVRPAPVIQTFDIVPTQIAGTETATATITLSAPASSGGAVIALSSDQDTVAYPSSGGNLIDSITIDAGATTATFEITSLDVTQAATVNITAELEGDVTTSSLTVAPWLTNLSLSPSAIVGGNVVTGRVLLYRPAPASGLTVSVTSSNPTIAYAIDASGAQTGSITVPAGATSATFPIKTRGVDVSTPVSILTRITDPSLQVVKSQTLTILPAKLKSLTFNPNHVNGGEKSVATILLDGEAGPTPVRFAMSLGAGTAVVAVPSPITVGARTTHIDFYASTGATQINNFRTLIATRVGVPAQTKSGTLFVDGNAISSITLSSNSVQGGATVTGFVNLVRPASAGGFLVTVTSSNTTVAPMYPNNPTLTRIPAGALRSFTWTIKTKVTPVDTNVTITASKPGYISKTATLTVKGVNLSFSMNPTSVVGGLQNSIGTLSLAEVPNTPITVQLSTNSNKLTVPASVTIASPNSSATFVAVSQVVTAPVNVTVTASVNAVPSNLVRTAVVTVTPPIPTLSSLTFNPSSVLGGNSSVGTVRLERIAPVGGVVVTLRKDPNSTGSAFCTVPATVTIPAGQLSANFTVTTTLPSRQVATSVTADIGPNSPTVSAVLTINRS